MHPAEFLKSSYPCNNFLTSSMLLLSCFKGILLRLPFGGLRSACPRHLLGALRTIEESRRAPAVRLITGISQTHGVRNVVHFIPFTISTSLGIILARFFMRSRGQVIDLFTIEGGICFPLFLFRVAALHVAALHVAALHVAALP